MKKFLALISISILIFLFGIAAGEKEQVAASEEARVYILAELSATITELNALTIAPAAERLSHYHQSRKHYKHIEFFVEYYSPREAKYFINGPLVPKHDQDQGNITFYPQGFQRIEEMLFSGDAIVPAELSDECKNLVIQLSALNNYYADVAIEDGQLLELCQLQLYRLAALTLNGYDGTISLEGITEAEWSLAGTEKVIYAFAPRAAALGGDVKKQQSKLIAQSADARKYLRRHAEYNSFDRLNFIVDYINPLNAALVEFHNTLQLTWNKNKQALNLQQPFLFGGESFNLRFFSMYYDDTLNISLQAKLGEKLFYDPMLSGNGMQSCSGCHQPGLKFTDGEMLGASLNPGERLNRNTPTLMYVTYQKSFFYDGRAYQLEQQVFDVVHNISEMNGTLDNIVERLREDATYRQLFAEAFAGTPDSSITAYAVQKVITEYEKTLADFSSRFDRFLRGDERAMNKREINGYNLFAGKALCGSCHFFPLFNGTVPPFFNDTEFEVIGTPTDTTNTQLDSDVGRFAVTKMDMHHRAFKTPTLRNVDRTGPYMHNGAYSTLTQVVEFYHKGGGRGLGFEVPNQTLPFDSLQLTIREKEDIVLFMKTLTDD